MGRLLPSPWLAVLTAAAPAAAQSVVALVAEGDVLPGAGTVTSIERALVRSTGDWLAVAHTDHPLHSEVLLRNGAVYQRVGDPAPGWPVPIGRLSGFGALGLDEWNIAHWLGDLEVLGQPTGSVQGRFTELAATTLTGDPVVGSAGAGATWESFAGLEFYADPGQGHGVLVGTIDDPTWPGGQRSLLILQSLIGIGACCFEAQVALSGEELSGVGRRIEAVRTHPGSFASSSDGAYVLWSCDLAGSELDDGCVVRRDWMLAQTVLAREGSPSPVPGRAWGALEDVGVDQAAGGHWTLRAQLDAGDPTDDEVLVRDGVVIAREGDVHAFSAPAPLVSLGRGRALLTQEGLAVWYAAWTGPTGPVEAIVFEDQPVIVSGATQVGGIAVAALDDGPLGLALSADGRYVVVRAVLADGRAALLRADLGGTTTYCTPKTSSLGCKAALSWSGPFPSAGAGAGFVVTAKPLNAQVPGMFFYGTSGAQSAPFHGGTLCVQPPLTRLAAQDSGGSIAPSCLGSLEVEFNAWAASGSDPALVAGAPVYLQAWYRDPGFAPPDDIGLTQALEFFLLP